MMPEARETPEIQLDRNDYEYMKGVQLGVLFGTLAAMPHTPINYVIDRDNVENVLRVCDALKRPFHATGHECSSGCHLEMCFDPAEHSRT
jgi:hypothetical protein